MPKRTLGLVAIVVAGLAAILWTLLAESRDTPSPTVQAPVAAVAATEPVEPPPTTAAREVTAPPASPAQPPEEVVAKDAIVRGRCLDAETSAPLAGCIVKLDGSPSNSGTMAVHGGAEWHEPSPVTTGIDGRFEIRFVPPPPYQHFLDIRCEGRVPRTARWGAFAPDQVEDLGDIAMTRGVTVLGQVVDTGGCPVASVAVSFNDLPLPIRPDMAANDSRVGLSGEDGRFTIDVPIPAGTWPLGIHANGYALVEPTQVTIAEQPASQEIHVVVGAQRFLSGVVVDERGQPVGGVYLVTKSKRMGKMESSWTRKDGSFRIYAREDAPESVQLVSHENGPCEPLDDERFFTWGTTDIRLVMKRALTFELTVIEAGSGSPVETYAIKCHSVDATWSNVKEARLGGHHDGGKLIVDKVVRGRNRLRIIPQDPQLAVSDELEFDAGDGELAPMRVELVRMVPLVVHLITTDDAPVADSRVELVRARGEPVGVNQWVEDFRSNASISSSRPLPLLLSRGTTDASGSVTLYGPPGVADLAIRALGPGHLPISREHILLPIEKPLDIVVSAGGTLRGTLTGDAVRAYHTRVRLMPSGDVELDRERQAITVASDGSFVGSGLPPGEYQMLLSIEVSVRYEGSGSHGYVDLLPPLGVASVEQDHETSVSFDTSSFNPGSLDARLVLDARFPKEARVMLQGRGGTMRLFDYETTSEWNLGMFVPDAAGNFHVDALPPGEYTLSVSFRDGTRKGGFIESRRSFRIQPGQKTTHVCELKRQRQRLHILGPDGAALGNTECHLFSDHGFFEKTTDGEGWIVLDPAPGISLRVRVEKVGVSEEVAVPGDESEVEAEVRLAKQDR
jgi:hypothetical protein